MSRRAGSHPKDVHAPGRYLHDEQYVQALEEDRVHGEVGPGRGFGLSTGPFPQAASRTRRACLQAPGAPQVPRGRVVPHPVDGQGVGMAVPR